MDYQAFFSDKLSELRNTGDYRTFADLEREAGAYPKAVYREGFGPMPEHFRNLPISELADAVSERTAAVFIEPIQGEGGCRVVEDLQALRDAAGRGVAVRLLSDAKFAETYPDTLDALGDVAGIEVRTYDMKPVRGGVQHAKFFRVDDAVWLGSQNFDWRSLEHIHELGVLVREPRAAADLGAVFEQDWAIAGGGPVPPTGAPPGSSVDHAPPSSSPG